MGVILSLICFLLIGTVIFVILGLLGWGVQLLGFIGNFFGEGINGCLGCFGKSCWFIFVGFIILALLFL